jgi:multidrug efflux pump subunit AcrA (membrane-fusion protein)
MEKLKNFLIKELTKEPQTKKPSLQDFAKRMLIGFFVLMLLLTMLSRAADSITVAKVNMALTKSGILNFKITGNGTVQAAAEKYLELYQGVKIEDIAVKVGQPVEKGDLLFTYDLQELKKVREGLQNEYTIASLNQEKGKLNVEAAAATTETETAGIAIKRAELDLKLAELEFKTAQSNLDKDKNNQLMTAKDAFTSAMDTKEETEEDKAQAMQEAQREVTKAEQALQELFKDKNKAEEVLAAYKTAALSSTTKISDTVSKPVNADNSEAVGIPGDLFYDDNEYSKSVIGISQSFQTMLQKVFTEKESKSTPSNIDPLSIAQKNIFKQYYGEETYNSHAEEVKQAQQKLIRAKEDYMLNYISIGESGGYLSTNQKAACIRAYEDANAALQKLTKKDRE